MCNASFVAGVLPASQKHAIVKPGLKKPTLNSDDLHYYRPISILSFISKTIERMVAVRFNEHCDAHKVLPICQWAYRACHWTGTAVTIVHNNIVRNIEQKDRVSMLVLLDLSAVFDTVDHALFEDLEKRFGIHGMILTYITARIWQNAIRYFTLGGKGQPLSWWAAVFSKVRCWTQWILLPTQRTFRRWLSSAVSIRIYMMLTVNSTSIFE